MTEGYYIEEVAGRTGLTARTLRFWEEKGLLVPPARTEGGLRLYSDADLVRIERIRELREVLGLSLDVIGQILAAEDQIGQLRQRSHPDMTAQDRMDLLRNGMAILQDQVEMIADRIARLQELQAGYRQRLQRLQARLDELQRQGGEK